MRNVVSVTARMVPLLRSGKFPFCMVSDNKQLANVCYLHGLGGRYGNWVRKDMMTGQAAHCSRFDRVYDREATIKLLRLFLRHPMVSKIFFNDDKVQQALGGRVRSMIGQDDHIHIEIWQWSLWT